MRHQVCVTLDEASLIRIREKMRSVNFRSRSHLIECAVEEYLKEGENDN